jgi:hypothetical protein
MLNKEKSHLYETYKRGIVEIRNLEDAIKELDGMEKKGEVSRRSKEQRIFLGELGIEERTLCFSYNGMGEVVIGVSLLAISEGRNFIGFLRSFFFSKVIGSRVTVLRLKRNKIFFEFVLLLGPTLSLEKLLSFFKIPKNSKKTVKFKHTLCQSCKKMLDSGAFTEYIDPDKLSRCSVCKSVYYCNRECQMKDWKEHKKICKHLK